MPKVRIKAGYGQHIYQDADGKRCIARAGDEFEVSESVLEALPDKLEAVGAKAAAAPSSEPAKTDTSKKPAKG